MDWLSQYKAPEVVLENDVAGLIKDLPQDQIATTVHKFFTDNYDRFYDIELNKRVDEATQKLKNEQAKNMDEITLLGKVLGGIAGVALIVWLITSIFHWFESGQYHQTEQDRLVVTQKQNERNASNERHKQDLDAIKEYELSCSKGDVVPCLAGINRFPDYATDFAHIFANSTGKKIGDGNTISVIDTGSQIITTSIVAKPKKE